MRQPPPDEENPDDKKKDKKGLKKNTPASGAKTNLKTPTPPEDEGLIPAPIATDNQSAVI